MGTKFEYLTKEFISRTAYKVELDNYGDSGWELVGIIHVNRTLFTDGKIQYIFKRERAK